MLKLGLNYYFVNKNFEKSYKLISQKFRLVKIVNNANLDIFGLKKGVLKIMQVIL